MPFKLDHPRFVALLIGIFAQALFSWQLAVPHLLVFDEVHYVPAARTLLALAEPRNVEHPMLGKELIALGMMLFGDNPVGWRALSTLAGTATVMGAFAILWLMYDRLRTATLGALMVLLNFTVFVQARIAMLDGFMAALVVCGTAVLLWAMRGKEGQARRRWLAGSVLLGLAAGAKWTAAPYVAFAGIAFLVARRGHSERWPGLGAVTGLVLLGAGSIGAYLLTFLPAFFYAHEPLTLATLLPFQLHMLQEQSQVLPPHTYQSDWTGWVLMKRPIWYLYEQADGAQRGILFLGNPAIMWSGLMAVLACLWASARDRDGKAGVVAAIWLASWLMWAPVLKSPTFFYYYYLSSIWLPLVIAAAIDHWRDKLRYWDEAFLLAAAILFVRFYPILAATELAGPDAFRRWTWFRSWV